MLSQFAKRVRDRIRGSEHREDRPRGAPLPPLGLRMGGKHFVDDDDFVRSAVRDVQRLERCGLGKTSRLLDWGCGAGRLAVGVKERWGRIGLYHGVDVQKRLIEWAGAHLAGPGFTFTLVDQANARYNPKGELDRTIPGDTADYDAFYAYSVFSHMLTGDVQPYLVEIRRLLSDGGFAFFTAFVEEGVEDEAENPAGYGTLEWSRPLHCVRFERSYFDGMIERAGLAVDRFEHGGETDGQSLYVVRPRWASAKHG